VALEGYGMMKFINSALSVISPLAAVPTGWAIYAGVTSQPAFPMNPIAAVLGAVAVIATSIAAGLLVTDIKTYNQGMKNKTERDELEVSTLPAWLVFGGCVLAEISLSLLIVVIPSLLAWGVLVFPLMTAAGVFAFALRFDLQQREAELSQLRAAEERKKAEQKAKKLATKTAKPAIEPAKAEPKPAFICSCGFEAKSQAALNAHQRKHKQIVGYIASFEPVTKEQAEKAK
jgi:glucan phosphoethanolaminetransferase (alkaline phosphatase superfamily)